MPEKIPHYRLFWFRLSCVCGFATGTEAIGLAGYHERMTEHEGYRVAWFELDNQKLSSDEFRIPLDVSIESVNDWISDSVVPRILELNGNCLWERPKETVQFTNIQCPACRQSLLAMVEDDPPDLQFTLNEHAE